MEAGSKGVAVCYDTISRITELIKCELVQIWRCTASREQMSLLVSHPNVRMSDHTIRWTGLVSGQAVARQQVCSFDRGAGGRTDSDWPRESHQQPERLVCIPVLNPWNLNHVVMLVNLFTKENPLDISEDALFELGKNIGLAIDAAVEDLCSAAAGHVNYLASRARKCQELLNGVRDLIRQFLNCQGVAIFLVDESRTRLELKATTGTEWSKPEREKFYTKNEGLTGFVWATGEPLLSSHAPAEERWIGKSREVVQGPEHNCLLFPLVTSPGLVRGVVSACPEMI